MNPTLAFVLLSLIAPAVIAGMDTADRAALEAAAKKGKAQAQFDLAQELRYGEGVDPKTRDAAAAIRWLKLAADQGHLEAQKNLGSSYSLGIGVAKGAAEAVRWYRKAADQGNAEARFHLALACQCGQGVKVDDAEALRWHRMAAEQGYPSSQTELGERYADGTGVARDDAEALRWLRLAADQGQPRGRVVLGDLFLLGRAGTRNPVCAYFWFAMAANRGWDVGATQRDWLAAKLTADELVYGKRLVEAAAASGNASRHPSCPGELVTLRFEHAALGDIVPLLATISGLKIVGDYDATKSIQVDLEDRPWEEAATTILHSAGLAWHRSGDTLVLTRPGKP